MKVCDVEKWVVMQLPLVLRRSKLTALVQVLVGQVGRLVMQWSRYADDVKYDIRHNSQVCKLRAMLNDRLDADQRRVDIVDAQPNSEMLIVYTRELGKPVLVGKGKYVVVPPRGYDIGRELNFVVRVPKEWRGTEKSMRLAALVNRGKLASMRYRIEYVQ